MRSFDRNIWAAHLSREWPAFAIVATFVTGMFGYDAWIGSGETVADTVIMGSVERVSLDTATWDRLQIVLTVKLADSRMVTILDASFRTSNCHQGDIIDLYLTTKSNGHQEFSAVPQSCRSR